MSIDQLVGQLGVDDDASGIFSIDDLLPDRSTGSLRVFEDLDEDDVRHPEQDDLAKLPMTIERRAAPVEQLTISAIPRPQLAERSGGFPAGGFLQLEWETTRVFVPFTVLK